MTTAPDDRIGVGLDIGATKTLGVVVDPEGAVLGRVQVPTVRGVEGVVATAATVVHKALAEAGSTGDTWPIGVGVPGLVDVSSGSVSHAVNLGLDGSWLPLRDLLADRLGRAVILENDVNTAALGATRLLAPGSVRDLAYLSLGTGLAAGLVLDGRLRRGVHGAAGEIGHLPVDPAGDRCECGQRGCLETMASGSRLAVAWPSPDGVPPAAALFRAAADGDPRARTVRDAFATAVASAVRVLCLTVDVEAVVLGGGVAQVGEPLRQAVSQALRAQAAGSPFLESLALADRLSVVPRDYPVAAVGAAMLGTAP